MYSVKNGLFSFSSIFLAMFGRRAGPCSVVTRGIDQKPTGHTCMELLLDILAC